MADRAQAAAAAIVDAVRGGDQDYAPYLAVVAGVVTDELLTIRPIEAATAGEQQVARVAGQGVEVGNTVVVMPLRGGVPIVLGRKGGTIDEASWYSANLTTEAQNTSTVNLVTQMSGTVTLPAGTWEVMAIGSAHMRQGQAADFLLAMEIDGVTTTMPSVYSQTINERMMLLSFAHQGGKTTSFAYALRFRSNTAGTCYANNGQVYMFARRVG